MTTLRGDLLVDRACRFDADLVAQFVESAYCCRADQLTNVECAEQGANPFLELGGESFYAGRQCDCVFVIVDDFRVSKALQSGDRGGYNFAFGMCDNKGFATWTYQIDCVVC